MSAVSPLVRGVRLAGIEPATVGLEGTRSTATMASTCDDALIGARISRQIQHRSPSLRTRFDAGAMVCGDVDVVPRSSL
jgi:hypothetical protein